MLAEGQLTQADPGLSPAARQPCLGGRPDTRAFKTATCSELFLSMVTKALHATDLHQEILQFPRICSINHPMIGLRPRHLPLLFAAVAGLTWSWAASAVVVEGLRVWAGPDHTRAVLDVTGPVEYKLFELTDPGRVVLDLDASKLASDCVVPGGSGLLQRIRTGPRNGEDLRVVLDLAGKATPKSFLLKPAGEHGYRLVIDLYPDSTPAVIERAPARATARDVVVVIDPGHGGDDPGAIGASGTYEKDIVLKVSKQLAEAINNEPGMHAVLTRDSDYYLPLKRRYQFAREHNADLFISVHADAFRSSDARGSSVWVLSPRGKTSEAARWLADRENRADLIGGVSLDDKGDTLARVLLDLSQGATMQISRDIADNVLAELAEIGPTHRGHVEKANFVVLRSPDVPSILVETAFITNPREERKLKSASHRRKLAQAILEGVREYFLEVPPPGSWFAARERNRPGQRHVVERGETLSAIAAHYKVSTASLRQANRLADADLLRAGAVLQIPAG